MEIATEKLLRDLLGNPEVSLFFVVENTGDFPRPIITKILSYRDHILRLAREKGELRLDSQVIRIFPDFSMGVQMDRRQFNGVIKMLRDRKIAYAMLFPAWLKFTHRNKLYFFTVPDEAVKYIEAHIPLNEPVDDLMEND